MTYSVEWDVKPLLNQSILLSSRDHSPKGHVGHLWQSIDNLELQNKMKFVKQTGTKSCGSDGM